MAACGFPSLLDSLIAKLKDILDSSREMLVTTLGIVVLQTNLQFDEHILILLITLIRKDKMRYLFKQRFCKAKFDMAILSCSLPFNSLTYWWPLGGLSFFRAPDTTWLRLVRWPLLHYVLLLFLRMNLLVTWLQGKVRCWL